MRNLLIASVIVLLAVAVSGCGCSSQRELLQMEQDRIALECKLEVLKAQREKYRQVAEDNRIEHERQIGQAKAWEEALRINSRRRDERIAKLEADEPNMVIESEERLDSQNRRLKAVVSEQCEMKALVRDFAVKHQPSLWREIEELRARVAVLVTKADEITQESARLGVISESCQDVIKRRDEVIRELRGKEMQVERMYIEEKTRGL